MNLAGLDQIIFTKKDILMKIKNLYGCEELYILKLKNDSVIWEKYFSLYNENLFTNRYININDLSYIYHDKSDNNMYPYIKIYKKNTQKQIINMMKYDNSVSELKWGRPVATEERDCWAAMRVTPNQGSTYENIDTNEYELDPNKEISFRDIPIHIDLMREDDNICPNPFSFYLDYDSENMMEG